MLCPCGYHNKFSHLNDDFDEFRDEALHKTNLKTRQKFKGVFFFFCI